MYLRWLTVFLLLWTVSVCSERSKIEVRLETANNIGGEEETLAVFRLRVVGRERFLNGTVTFLVDLDNNYNGSLDVYSFKNGEWVQSYFNIRTNPCDLFTNFLKKYYFPPDADTNIPFGEDNCLKEGQYYFKNMPIAVEKWPTFPFRGLVKTCVNLYTLKGKAIGGFEVICHVTEKPT